MEQPAATTTAEAAPATTEVLTDAFAIASAEYERGMKQEGAGGGEAAVPDADAPSDQPTDPTPDDPAPPAEGTPSDPDVTPDADARDTSSAEEGSEDTPLSRRERARLRDLERERDEAQAELRRLKDGPPVEEKVVGEFKDLIGADDSDGKVTLERLTQMIDDQDWDGLSRVKRPDGTVGFRTIEDALDLKAQWSGMRRRLGGVQGLLTQNAWNTIAMEFDAAAKAAGLDPLEMADRAAKAVADGKATPASVYLTEIRKAEREQAMAEGAKPWREKHDKVAEQLAATKREFEAYKREAAGSGDVLESGGRPASLRNGHALESMSGSEILERAMRGEFRDLDLTRAG